MQSKNVETFINYIKRICKKYNIKFEILSNNEIYIHENVEVGGYFCDNPLEMKITKKSKRWLDVLVHEFSHLEQWLYKDPSYINTNYKKSNSYIILYKWLNGKKYKKKTIDTCIKKIILCELNCEIRSLKNINKFKLPINKNLYIKRANAYIYEYNYIKLKKMWDYPSGKLPSDIPEILKAMPNNFENNYFHFPKKLLKLYNKYLIIP